MGRNIENNGILLMCKKRMAKKGGWQGVMCLGIPNCSGRDEMRVAANVLRKAPRVGSAGREKKLRNATSATGRGSGHVWLVLWGRRKGGNAVVRWGTCVCDVFFPPVPLCLN